MGSYPIQGVRRVLFLLPVLLAILACSSQTITPTLLSRTLTGTPIPSQRTSSPLTMTPMKGPGASPTSSLTGEVGDRIISGGAAVTVINTKRVAQIGLFTAAPGNIYIDIEVLVENESRADAVPYNPFYFKVKDGNGISYSTALASMEPSLKTGYLGKGEKVRGHIAFDVNARSAALTLSFEPNIYLANYQVIRFNLSQKSNRPVQVPTLRPQVINGTMGERADLHWAALTGVKLSSPDTIGVYHPSKGYIYLDIEVVIENTGSFSQLPYTPLYFKIKDVDGYEYTTALVALEPNLMSGDLAPGEKTTGHVAFEVRKEAKGLVLIFEPVVLFKEYGKISIALGE